MILGNINEFAIEYNLLEVDKQDGNTYYFGDIFFWIGSKKIGDDKKVSYLSSSVSYLKDFLDQKKLRQFLGSERIPAKELFHVLYERFYDMVQPTKDDYLEAGEFRDVFSMESIGQENFMDEVKIVLIDEPTAERQRILWKLYKNDILDESFIPYNQFEVIAQSFIISIERDVYEWQNNLLA